MTSNIPFLGAEGADFENNEFDVNAGEADDDPLPLVGQRPGVGHVAIQARHASQQHHAEFVAADAEICAMLADCLEAVGIERGDYVVRVNNRKVLNGVMEVAGVLDPSDPEKFAHERGIVLRAIDKLDRLGPDGVRALLGKGRKDESGDFTDGAGLNESQTDHIMGFVNSGERISAKLAEYLNSEQKAEGASSGSSQAHSLTADETGKIEFSSTDAEASYYRNFATVAVLEELVVCDTIPLKQQSDKIKVLSTDELFAVALRNAYENKSINSLFIRSQVRKKK